MATSHTMVLSYLLCLNLMFFTLVSANYYVPTPCPPPPSGGGGGGPPKSTPPSGGGTPGTPTGGGTPKSTPPSGGTPGTPSGGGTPKSTPPSAASPPSSGGSDEKCPIDILKLGACANVLSGLVGVVLGVSPSSQCCPLLSGLTDLDAAICLCTALKASVLGINLNVPVSLSVLLNYCKKKSDFQCS